MRFFKRFLRGISQPAHPEQETHPEQKHFRSGFAHQREKEILMKMLYRFRLICIFLIIRTLFLPDRR